MGCDIHFYVEVRQSDGSWKSADAWTPDDWSEEPGALTVDYKKQFYNDRNYNLFSILADVRNGRGFAGVKTGAGFVPIAEPRGVPADTSPEYGALQERYGCDGHSHSYLTVAEIMAYDWTQTTTLCGFVGISDWARWRDYGEPQGWSGGVWGGEVRHLEPREFEAAWQALRAEKEWPEERYAFSHLGPHSEGTRENTARMVELLGGGSPYTQVEWVKPYYECAKDFLGETLPRLWALGKPEDVRAVFFFDN